MSDTNLGTLLTGTPSRDAVHFAIAPVTTNEILHPGQHVGLVKDSTTEVTAKTKKTIGIVDPFLKTKVMPGDRFYLMLYQATVTGMKHVWTHASFPEAPVVEPVSPLNVAQTLALASKTWLQGFADEVGLHYIELLAAAKDYLDHGEYLNHGSRWEGQSVPPEFWDHYETVTQTKVSESQRGGFFSCSC